MSEFFIGPFRFISLSRFPPSQMQRLEREAAAGFAGVTLWRTGVRSEPFQATSVVDTGTLEAAQDLMRGYEAAVGTVLPVIWAGRELGNYAVLHVEPLEDGLHKTLLGIGGTNGTSTALIRCSWTLEFIPLLNPPGQ